MHTFLESIITHYFPIFVRKLNAIPDGFSEKPSSTGRLNWAIPFLTIFSDRSGENAATERIGPIRRNYSSLIKLAKLLEEK